MTDRFFSESASEVARRVDAQMEATLGESEFSLPQKLALACRMLAQEGHARTLAGQVTARDRDSATFWSTNFKLGFSEARASNLLRIDSAMSVIEGEGMANPAVRFHMWIYEALPHVKSIVHTHPPFASALSMLDEPLTIAHMDATVFYEDCAWLREWPGVPIANEEGRIICEALGQNHSILLAHHGLLTIGQTLEEAVFRAILFEQAAQMQLVARSAGTPRTIKPELARGARDFLLKQSFINATFNYWARRTAEAVPDALR